MPKGAKDCTGKECEQDLQFEIDVPETKATTQVIPTPSIDFGNAQPQQMAPPIPPPAPDTHNHAAPKITHEDIKQLIPKGINKMKCPSGNCGNEALTNPIQTKKYKTCPNGNCGANTLPKDSEFCPYCSKNITEDDDLDDGIDLTSDEDDE